MSSARITIAPWNLPGILLQLQHTSKTWSTMSKYSSIKRTYPFWLIYLLLTLSCMTQRRRPLEFTESGEVTLKAILSTGTVILRSSFICLTCLPPKLYYQLKLQLVFQLKLLLCSRRTLRELIKSDLMLRYLTWSCS